VNQLRRLFVPKTESTAVPVPAAPVTAQPEMNTATPTLAGDQPPTPVSGEPLAAVNGTPIMPPESPVIQDNGLPLVAKPELLISEPNGADALDLPAAPDYPRPHGQVMLATRQLTPPEAAQVRSNAHLTFGYATDAGHVRMNNEDALATLLLSGRSSEQRPDMSLFVIADGMGGRDNGEQASAIAVRVLSQQVVQNLYLEMLASEGDVREGNADRPSISEVVSAAVQSANAVVSQKVPDGGTTLTAALIIGDMAYFGHVGDSRAYLITAHNIEQITRDHSLVQRLIELEQLTPEEAVTHSQRNVLYRALGQGTTLEIDTSVRRLPANSYLLLCSDGLWNMVPQELIAQLVRSASSLSEACDRLVQAANQRGGPDNISVILVQTPT